MVSPLSLGTTLSSAGTAWLALGPGRAGAAGHSAPINPLEVTVDKTDCFLRCLCPRERARYTHPPAPFRSQPGGCLPAGTSAPGEPAWTRGPGLAGGTPGAVGGRPRSKALGPAAWKGAGTHSGGRGRRVSSGRLMPRKQRSVGLGWAHILPPRGGQAHQAGRPRPAPSDRHLPGPGLSKPGLAPRRDSLGEGGQGMAPASPPLLHSGRRPGL